MVIIDGLLVGAASETASKPESPLGTVRPKVLMIGPYPPPYGGIAVVVRDLVASPLSTKVDLRLLRSQPPREGSSNPAGDYVVRMSNDFRSLLRDIRQFRPEVVHIHTSYDWGWPRNVTLALISKLSGAKVILHIHAYDRRCKEGFPKTKLRRFIYTPDAAFDLVDQVFTLSDKFTNNILASYPDMKVKTISNCITMARYLDSKEKVRGEKIVVSYIGRLDRRKGIRELLEAVERISSLRSDVTFKIAGVGPEKEYVEDWIRRSSASSAVEYRGFISEEDKIHLLKETDIFVLQSTNEGVPISILEAIASGCAIIATPVGSVSDVVFHEKNGLMIPPEDPEALVEAILLLGTDQTMLERMQKENLATRSRYSWESMSGGIADIYTSLAND